MRCRIGTFFKDFMLNSKIQNRSFYFLTEPTHEQLKITIKVYSFYIKI